ncbi:MAG: hypothetical protein GEV04_09075 [Actinophytocola sp.]|nr:hypothetical protein [Actinophytocola sp.]
MTTATADLTAPATGRLLRTSLVLDGIATGLTGVLIAALSGMLDTVLGPSTAFVLGVGLFFVAYGATVLVIGTRGMINRGAAGAVAGANLLWTVVSVIVVIAGTLSLTTLGVVTALALAVVTTVFAELQITGLRRS